MKRTRINSLLMSTVVFGSRMLSPGAVLLDDTWADGTRTDQNLPTESRWFTSEPTLMTAYTNYLSITNLSSSSQWYTYFTPEGSLVRLNPGESLTLELSLIPKGVGSTNTSKNFRVGLFASTGVRPTGDGGIPGTSYAGYSAFCNFTPWWTTANAFELRQRTTFVNADPLNSSGESPTILSGGANTETQAFSNDVPYKLTLALTRVDATTMDFSAAWSGGDLTNALTATDTSGIYTDFDCLEIRPSGFGTTATNFILTQVKITGPAPTETPPFVSTQPQGQSITVGDFAFFKVVGGGAPPIRYQWYKGTTPVANATNATLLLTNVQSGQAGDYRVILTNNINSATSDWATLTVSVPTATSRGLIVNDTWRDGLRQGVVDDLNAHWVASLDVSLTAFTGSMLAQPAPGAARAWLGYFRNMIVPDPVHLAVGDAIKATLVFTPTNVAPQNTGSLRFGLYDFSAGGTYYADDYSGFTANSGGTQVRGYMLMANFGTTFGDGTPLEFQVRNNVTSSDLLGSTADYQTLGSGPNGSLNDPAFASGTQYTLEYSIARTDVTTAEVSARFTGGTLDISHSAREAVYGTHRFDAFVIRANRTTDSATDLNISQFTVEVIQAPTLPFSISSAQFIDLNKFALTWPSISGRTYEVRSTPGLAPPSWVTNAVVVATSGNTSWTNTSATGTRFYQVFAR